MLALPFAATRATAAEVEPQQIAAYGDLIDISRIAPGDWQVILLDTDPVFARRRTPAEIALARATPADRLPDPARDEDRAPGQGEWLVVSGLCTHENCPVMAGVGPYGGWSCFCHGSIYDLSGRVRSGPAKKNLPVIRHEFRDGDRMVLIAG